MHLLLMLCPNTKFLTPPPLRVPPLRRVTFYKRLKSNQKRLLLRAARSLRLGVPSLRNRSGRSAYGLLRCTSSRCVWLRQTVAALCSGLMKPDTHLGENARQIEVSDDQTTSFFFR
ncbi:hypothetical protein C0J26_24250 [Pseudomonas baetica]|nr:hypothetical protein C0J26_24250 [Pseudomonas baetica]